MRTILQMTKITFLTLNVQQFTIPHEIIITYCFQFTTLTSHLYPQKWNYT